MSKGPFHDDNCSHCGDLAKHFTHFASGEPVQLCDSDECAAKHCELKETENSELHALGML